MLDPIWGQPWSGLREDLVGVTMTPALGEFLWENSRQACDLQPRLFRPERLIGISELSLNVWMYLPVGALAMLATSRTRAVLFGVACGLPVASEAVQYWFPALGRSCQAVDPISNWAGGLSGVVVGALVLLLRVLSSRWNSGRDSAGRL